MTRKSWKRTHGKNVRLLKRACTDDEWLVWEYFWRSGCREGEVAHAEWRHIDFRKNVVAGFSNKEIAGYFKIAEDTVKHHLSNIFDKIGVSTRLELALFAVNQSLPLACLA